MSAVQVDIDESDLGQVIVDLEVAADQVSRGATDTRNAFALRILRDARQHAPVDTGFLQSSGGINLQGGQVEQVVFNKRYAAVQEFGSEDRGIEGKKYLTRAWKKHREAFQRAMRGELEGFSE